MFKKMDLIMPEEPFDGPMQMALDEVLLKNAVNPTLRIYRWMAPCVSFGYFQKFKEVRETHPVLPLVRRWTGGGIVEHGSDLTFSLMIPKENAVSGLTPALFYKKLHHAFAEVFILLVKEEIHLAGDEDILTGSACFSAPAKDDLLLQGQKILGGAQRRSAGALLYQGSLQKMDQMIAREGVNQIVSLMAGALSKSAYITSIPAFILDESSALTESHYAHPGWNTRR